MSDFEIAFIRLCFLEFSNALNVLHKNKTEKDITYYGIYRLANPNWQGWQVVDKILKSNNYNFKKSSEILYNNNDLTKLVKDFYKKEFWDKIKGNEIKNQEVANILFIFAVNVGLKKSIKILQQFLNLKIDGIFGNITLNALNSYNPNEFIIKFKYKELKFYENLVRIMKNLKNYLKGWINRIYLS